MFSSRNLRKSCELLRSRLHGIAAATMNIYANAQAHLKRRAKVVQMASRTLLFVDISA